MLERKREREQTSAALELYIKHSNEKNEGSDFNDVVVFFFYFICSKKEEGGGREEERARGVCVCASV